MRLAVLSDQLTVVALVGRYPANKLMVYGPIPSQEASRSPPFGQARMPAPATFGFSTPFGALSPATGQIAHIVLALPPLSPMKSYCYSSIGSRSTCMPNPRCQRSF